MDFNELFDIYIETLDNSIYDKLRLMISKNMDLKIMLTNRLTGRCIDNEKYGIRLLSKKDQFSLLGSLSFCASNSRVCPDLLLMLMYMEKDLAYEFLDIADNRTLIKLVWTILTYCISGKYNLSIWAYKEHMFPLIYFITNWIYPICLRILKHGCNAILKLIRKKKI